MSTFDAVSVEKSHRRAFLHKRWLHVGAADEARTRYLHLGKVALYQMSYGRILETLLGLLTGASDRNRTNDTGIFSPLLYRLSYRGIKSAFIPALPRIHLLNRGPRKNLRTQGFVGKRRNFSACHCNLACKIARQAADIPTKRPGSGSNRRPPA